MPFAIICKIYNYHSKMVKYTNKRKSIVIMAVQLVIIRSILLKFIKVVIMNTQKGGEDDKE